MRLPPRGYLEPTGPFDAIELYDRFGVGWILRRRLRWLAAHLDPRGMPWAWRSGAPPAREAGPIGRILEIGYGSGVFQYELSARARMSVAIDVHPYAARVRRRLADDGVSSLLARGSAVHLPFATGSFDRVVIVSVLEFVSDLGHCLRECLRVLAPGGRLLLLTPRRLWWADLLWNVASGWSAESDFRSGRERVQQAIADQLPAVRRLSRPAWLPRFLAPYEVVISDAEPAARGR